MGCMESGAEQRELDNDIALDAKGRPIRSAFNQPAGVAVGFLVEK